MSAASTVGNFYFEAINGSNTKLMCLTLDKFMLETGEVLLLTVTTRGKKHS